MQIEKASFTSDAIKMTTASVVVQVLTVFSAPILTRLFSPEAFGLSALFSSFVPPLSILITLQYEMAINLPKCDSEASEILKLSILVSSILSFLIYAIFVFFDTSILQVFKASELKPFVWLIILSTFGSGLQRGLNNWVSRKREFGLLSIANVVQSSIGLVLNLIFGFLGLAKGTFLIISGVAGQAITIIYMLRVALQTNLKEFLPSLSVKSFSSIAKRYKKFPLINTWSVIISSVSWQLPYFLLAAYFSTSTVGYFSQSNKLLSLPMGMVGSALATVFFQRAAQAKLDGRLGILSEEIIARLIKFGLFPLLILSLVGKEVFIVVFGSGWAEAGVYSQLLSILTFLWFVFEPLNRLIIVVEKQELGLLLNVLLLITRSISLIIGGITKNIYLGLLLYSVSGIVIYLILGALLLRAAKARIEVIAKVSLKVFSFFLPCGLVLIVLKAVSILATWEVIVSTLFVILFYLFLFLFDNAFKADVLEILKSLFRVKSKTMMEG